MAPSPSPYICFNCRLAPRNTLPLLQPYRSFATTRRHQQILRPATAPKPTPDVKHIRQNAELYAQNCIVRNYAGHAEYPSKIQALSDEARQLEHGLKAPRSQIKQLEKTIAKLSIAARQASTNGAEGNEQGSATKKELEDLKSEAQRLKDESHAMTVRQSACTDEINRLALSLPNLSSPETPIGDDPRLVHYLHFDPQSPPAWTLQSPTELQARSHVAIGTELGLLDFTSSATTTGWGWYFLVNEGAMLEQALVQYALSVARRRGWKTVSPPSIVYSYIAEACGFQPRDQHNEQQIWSIEQNERDRDTKPPRSLTGTAEIPLAAMYAGRDINASELPIKLVGASRCYRAEAGSRGVDTKGLYRVHEFTKVELFAWTDNLPSDAAAAAAKPTSDTLFAELLDIQTEILTSLHLPCRVLEMPTGDLGASATRKRDIEALFPSRFRPTPDSTSRIDPAVSGLESAWGEVTSASVCTDYQSRRLATRARGGAPKESRFPHTVNGTAMAVPRVLAAILENGWDAERGVVVVPEVLRPWMDGMETIGRRE
ncbi:seryl-tRNA synthetase [Penicillium brasilianum]|uniref:serine--tRNA ligase n=1 Tax=Penicillium brasilianum TaxID=104259 RepID=A0A1S9R838_PENBI|nr:seryl-tRNA synthetase [Penicillium brasilianum]